ncbi:hypothetical protein [Succinispira mobilis]|uniref:hypothetical protein n=1 Tax=Succinispira mobilis TaxID=78120 RepID=UPI000374AA11|nr:hypothetical protein [Succinispira mobilis]
MFLKSNSKNWQTKLTLWGLVANLVLQPIFSSTVLAEQSQVEVDKNTGKIYADEIALAGGEINNYAEGAVAPVI